MGELLQVDELRAPRTGVMVTHAPMTIETMCLHRIRVAIKALAYLRAAHLPALEVAIMLDRALPAARLVHISGALAMADAAIAHAELMLEHRDDLELATLTSCARSARDSLRPRVRALLAAHAPIYAAALGGAAQEPEELVLAAAG